MNPLRQTAPSVAELHRLAIRCGFPRDQVHEILHECAVAGFQVDSLTELDDTQRRQFAGWIREHQRSSSAHRPPPARPRRGAPKREGVLRMISPKQRALVNTLCSELGWTQSTLSSLLRTHFGAGSIDELGTSARAGELINYLIGCNRQRERQRRGRPRRNMA